jgi:hypothetical protein
MVTRQESNRCARQVSEKVHAKHTVDEKEDQVQRADVCLESQNQNKNRCVVWPLLLSSYIRTKIHTRSVHTILILHWHDGTPWPGQDSPVKEVRRSQCLTENEPRHSPKVGSICWRATPEAHAQRKPRQTFRCFPWPAFPYYDTCTCNIERHEISKK